MGYKVGLKEQKRLLEKGIKWEEDMIKNNKSYTNPDTGKTYGPEHYKKALVYDKQDLKRVNTKLEMREKVKALKNAAKNVRNNKPEIKSTKDIFKTK